MRTEEYCRSLILRLAKYHNAEFVDNDLDNGLYFRFKCGNEVMTWDKTDENGHAAFDANLVTDAKVFLNNYIGKHMFFRETGNGFDSWSDDFNMFGQRMIKAGSHEELELKLATRGY